MLEILWAYAPMSQAPKQTHDLMILRTEAISPLDWDFESLCYSTQSASISCPSPGSLSNAYIIDLSKVEGSKPQLIHFFKLSTSKNFDFDTISQDPGFVSHLLSLTHCKMKNSFEKDWKAIDLLLCYDKTYFSICIFTPNLASMGFAHSRPVCI